MFIMNLNQYLPQSLQIIIVFLMSMASTLVTAQVIYPEKAVTLVVPYGPGGMGDRLARLSSEKL